MLLFRRSLAVLLLLFSSLVHAQKTWPSTMLWRITGNGLRQPSYLFGTMHVQDKRLFNFTDSLYHFIQQAEGFALEVDFKDYMDSLINRTIVRRQKEWLEDDEKDQVVDTRSVGKDADTLLRQLGLDRKTLTGRQLKKIREYRLSRLSSEGEMPTIVDAYLFGIALRQGKWTGGIEDVTDQMDVMNELGQNINPKDVFAPEQELRFSLEQMKQIYLKEDLQRIAEISYANNRDPFTQRMLIQRNVKMARRMDSLTRYRSMFFAVGAAHLPSDSGVIALLRRKGFRVEPVFSTQRFAAETMAARLGEIAWKPVQDEEKLFTVQMPGTPSAFSVFGEVVKMNMFFDITTMTFYMAGSTLAETRTQKELSASLNSIAAQSSVKGTVKSRKDISTPEWNGVEGRIENSEGSYRIRLIQKGTVLYMLMAGSSKKFSLGPDVDRFFKSFVPHAPQAKAWTTLALAEKGVRISFPGTPKRNSLLESKADAKEWTFTAYDHMDVSKGIYFLFHVRETGPTFNLDGDSSYFDAFQEQLNDSYDTVLRREITTYQGHPAFHLWTKSSKGKVVYRTLNVLRGNRVYVLMVGLTENSESAAADRFMQSLELTDYPRSDWKPQTSVAGGFRTAGSEPFREVEDEDENEDEVEEEYEGPDPFRRRHFVAYDPVRAISLDVFRTPLSPFFWSADDSTFFADRSAQFYSEFSDTLLFSGPVMVGGLKGWETRYQPQGGGNINRLLMTVSRDTLYTLYTVVPPQPGFELADRFFREFRVAREEQPTIYTPRVPALLAALRTRSKRELSRAREVLNGVEFRNEDLPLVRKALLENYVDEEDGLSITRSDILRVLVNQDQADSAVAFVREVYPKLPPAKEPVRYTLLTYLVEMDADTCWALARELVARGLPKEGNPRRFMYALRSSTKHAALMMPELLKASADSASRELISDLAVALDRDTLLDRSLFRTWLPLYLADARASLEYVKEHPEEGYMAYSWAEFAGLFNEPQCLALLRDFLKLEDKDLHQVSVIGLLRHRQQVDASVIEGLASDKVYRLELYEQMERFGSLNLFPKAWASQRLLAESEIYTLASDDWEPSAVDYIGERTATFRGKKQKFLLFHVHDEEDNGYLGIAGPYLTSNRKNQARGSITGLLWDEDFDQNRIDEQFKRYLKEHTEE